MMQTTYETVSLRPRRQSAQALLPLYLGFLATGIGVALPGALLPVLLTRWNLQDQDGGRLFLLAWVGSSLGALLVRSSMSRATAAGSLIVASALVALALVSTRFAFVCMFFYGLGLGLTMTSMSLMLQRRASLISADEAKRALVRLNLAWALGACFGPLLTLHSLATAGLRPLLYPFACCFLLLAAWALAQPIASGEKSPNASPSFGLMAFLKAMPPVLILLIMLTTGVEASAGAWLSTYAKRGGDPVLKIVAAPTCLWAGLLLSRFFWSFARMVDRWVVGASLLLTTTAAFTLLATRHGWPLLGAAFCIGFGIGPVYPILLARALRFHSSGLIFFLAGLGSACLPWLTGLASYQEGSLHKGFFVPALASLLLLILSFGQLAAPRDNKAA